MSKWDSKYEYIKNLGEGGNADVFMVHRKSDSAKYALKQLKSDRLNAEKKYRFKEEVKIMSEKHRIGMLPVLEVSSLSGKNYWYTMPVAKTISKHIKSNCLNLVDIINGFIQLTETLCELHKENISHRDIKPDNIYYYEDRFTLGDFGLVNYPDMEQRFTTDSKWLGAMFTIAPEMRQNPKSADGCKADVIHLQKPYGYY